MGHSFDMLTFDFLLKPPQPFTGLFFCIPGFGRKVSLIFLTNDLTFDLKLISIIGLSDLVNSLIFANSCPG